MPTDTLASPWSLSGPFDDGIAVDLSKDDESLIFAEIQPTDGPDLDQWGQESIARAKALAAVPTLLDALNQIRKKGYAATFGVAPAVLLECVALAEEALRIAMEVK
jgi:hypothetical protein